MTAKKSVDRFFEKEASEFAPTVADLLSRAAGHGPRASELVSLVDLAGLLIQAPGGEGLTRGQAERELLCALLGDGDWAGCEPSRLAVYCPWGTGYLELDDEVSSFTWCEGQSLRAGQLRWLWSRHLEGAGLANIEPSPGLGIQALAVLREPALAAFGMHRPAAAVALPSSRRLVGVPVSGLPEPEALVVELRDMKARKIKGPVQRLAEKYSCSRDTISRRLSEARSSAAIGVATFPRVARSR